MLGQKERSLSPELEQIRKIQSQRRQDVGRDNKGSDKNELILEGNKIVWYGDKRKKRKRRMYYIGERNSKGRFERGYEEMEEC